MRVCVVVPTIREDRMRDFLRMWERELAPAHILVVEDNPTRTFHLSTSASVAHYAWEDIDRDLGGQSWIIPRRTDAIRSYGFYKAYLERPDLIITLDDDCYPEEGQTGFIQRHWTGIQAGGLQEAWRPTGRGAIPRGVPYVARSRRWPCAINHGLWTGLPDYDAPTQLLHARQPSEFAPVNQTIPVGLYFPMCAMNLAFLPDVVPALYCLLMGRDYAYDRFGDIWAGIFVKKICDHLGYAVNSGEPCVAHQRASDVWENLRKEAPGLPVNEELWIAVDRVVLHGRTFADCYVEIARQLDMADAYWTKLKEAMVVWAGLFTAVS
ncbi:MAG: hypothetical protein HY660_14785 [Armatimonadetes bacterium]|nr:hypothetical protein [Armatimonadota bacterium]